MRHIGLLRRSCQRIVLSATLSLLVLVTCQAQLLNTSIRGENSVIYKGGSFGFDLAKESISFDWYGNSSTMKGINIIEDHTELVWGISALAKGKEKVIKIFNEGRPASEANMNLLGGISWYHIDKRKQLAPLLKSLKSKDILIDNLIKAQERACVQAIVALLSPLPAYNGIRNTIASSWQNRLAYYKSLSENSDTEREGGFWDVLRKDLKTDAPIPSDIQTALGLVDTYEGRSVTNSHSEYLNKEALIDQYMTIDGNNSYPEKYTVYANTGFNDVTYKQFTGIDTSQAFAKAFKSESEFAPYFTVGFNAEFEKTTHGAFIQFLWGNNFTTLSSSDYIIRNVTTTGSSTLTEEKKITGYDKEVVNVNFLRLRYDFILDLALGDNSILALNPFIRHAQSFNSDSSPNLTDIGITGYFYKKQGGKLLGGVSLEFNDLANNFQAFSESTRSSNPIERFTISLTGKYLFGSFAPKFGSRVAEAAPEGAM